MLVDTPRGGWSVEKDAEAGALRQDGVVLAVVRDATGRAVRKLSQRYALAEPSDKSAVVSKGRVLVYKETTLQPGTYTVDFVSRDLLGGTAGTRMSDLKVASPLAKSTGGFSTSP